MWTFARLVVLGLGLIAGTTAGPALAQPPAAVVDTQAWATPAEYAACRRAVVRACFKPGKCEWAGQGGPCMVSTCTNIRVGKDKDGADVFAGPGGYDGGTAGSFTDGMIISKDAFDELRTQTLDWARANPDSVSTCSRKFEAVALFNAYATPAEKVGQSGVATRVVTPEALKICTDTFDGIRKQLLAGPGTEQGKARALGRMQKSFFSGGCAIHPEARARVAEAERMTQTGKLSEPPRPKRAHVPEAAANDCLSLNPKATLYGGFVNSCPYAVEFYFCNYRPKKGSWGEAFDCETSHLGTWQVSANDATTQHTTDAERVHWFACKYGATMHEPIGISPSGVAWNPETKRLRGRCGEWGAK